MAILGRHTPEALPLTSRLGDGVGLKYVISILGQFKRNAIKLKYLYLLNVIFVNFCTHVYE